ncbi:MAG TPA: hypothetical protein DF613_14835 [Lachnospiraceae bacterium]|nr:hypothetical protein [Lachnospiraceae bacterium]
MSDSYYDYTQGTNENYSFHEEPELPQPPVEPGKPKKERRRLKRVGAAVSTGVVFGLTAGLVFYGVVKATGVDQLSAAASSPNTVAATGISQTPTAQTTASAVQEAEGNSGNSGDYTVSQIAKECLPSVVSISSVTVQEVQSFFGSQSYEVPGAGSGFIVGKNDTELLIVTNNHVVAGAENLSVCFNDDEKQVYEAVVKGTDPGNDLAVVAIDLDSISEDTMKTVKIVTLGDSDKLEVGEQVVAIGNALGSGQSVTSGYVSALNREVTIDNMTASLIQTDAAINPGNSGGALINMKGEVVGINSAKYADEQVEGMGYAIPITTAKEIIDELMARETRRKVDEADRGYLGINCRNVTAEVVEMYNIPEGVYVDEVGEGGAAAAAGIKKGDIITKFDGQTVSDKETLVRNLEYYKAGETVEVVIQRASGGEYQEQTLQVTLAKQVMSSADDNNSQGSQNPNSRKPYQYPDGNGEEEYRNGSGNGLFDDWLN